MQNNNFFVHICFDVIKGREIVWHILNHNFLPAENLYGSVGKIKYKGRCKIENEKVS